MGKEHHIEFEEAGQTAPSAEQPQEESSSLPSDTEQTIYSKSLNLNGHVDGVQKVLKIYFWRYIGQESWTRALIFINGNHYFDPYDVPGRDDPRAANFWQWVGT